MRGLERTHRGFRFGSVDAVDGEAERALDEFDLPALAFGADRDVVFGRRRRAAGRGDGLPAAGRERSLPDRPSAPQARRARSVWRAFRPARSAARLRGGERASVRARAPRLRRRRGRACAARAPRAAARRGRTDPSGGRAAVQWSRRVGARATRRERSRRARERSSEASQGSTAPRSRTNPDMQASFLTLLGAYGVSCRARVNYATPHLWRFAPAVSRLHWVPRSSNPLGPRTRHERAAK